MSRSRSAVDEESIYNNCLPKAAQPVVRTFNIVVQPPPPNLSGAIGPAPSPTYPQYAGPKPKMHVDSSQVRGLGWRLIILPCCMCIHSFLLAGYHGIAFLHASTCMRPHSRATDPRRHESHPRHTGRPSPRGHQAPQPCQDQHLRNQGTEQPEQAAQDGTAKRGDQPE